MPLTAEELRRFAALERTVVRLTERIETLEKREVNLERLIAAANQAGAMFAGLAQNQTVVKTPAKKWEPV
jgi:hypothetical protein